MKSTISTKILESFLIRTNDPRRKLYQHRLVVLIVTYLVYTIYHMSRKPMSVVKTKWYNGNASDPNNWPPFNQPNSNALLSALDGAYWGAYALGMFVSGYIAERSDLRYFLTVSLILCGLTNIIFGMAYYLNIHSMSFFLAISVLTGLAESSGWPAVLAIIGSWYGSAKKGLIFGVWSLHTTTGNILGSALAGAFVDRSWGLSFIVPGIICIAFAAVAFVLLVPNPSDVDLKVDMTLPKNNTSENTDTTDPEQSTEDDDDDNKEGAISIWQALKIPGVVEFSICLFFTKSVSYIFLNWLPKFISSTNQNVTSSQAAYMSTIFDVGGSVGSIMSGLTADLTNAGAMTCVLFLWMAIPSLFLMAHFSNVDISINLILQFMTGFFIVGPFSLITTAVSANLACKVPTRAAIATVSAIVDGTGSIGAAIGPSITGPIYDHFKGSWTSVFYLCMLGMFIASICLLRVAFEELRNNRWSLLNSISKTPSSLSTTTTTFPRSEINRHESESSGQTESTTNDDTKNIC